MAQNFCAGSLQRAVWTCFLELTCQLRFVRLIEISKRTSELCKEELSKEFFCLVTKAIRVSTIANTKWKERDACVETRWCKMCINGVRELSFSPKYSRWTRGALRIKPEHRSRVHTLHAEEAGFSGVTGELLRCQPLKVHYPTQCPGYCATHSPEGGPS